MAETNAEPGVGPSRTTTEYESMFQCVAQSLEYLEEFAIHFPPENHELTAASMRSTPTISRAASLGRLDTLPLELVHHICLGLDLVSIFIFSQVSRRARQVLWALHEYRVLMKTSLACFRASLMTGTGRYVNLAEFYRLLCTKCCGSGHWIPRHGHYVFLLTWRRYCDSCMQGAPSGQLAGLQFAKECLRSRGIPLPDIPVLRNIFKAAAPIFRKRQTKRYNQLVLLRDVMQAYGTPDRNSRIFHSHRIWLFQTHRSDAFCALPYYSECSGKIEPLFGCLGCREEKTMASETFTKEELLAHFENCEAAQSFWEARRSVSSELVAT